MSAKYVQKGGYDMDKPKRYKRRDSCTHVDFKLKQYSWHGMAERGNDPVLQFIIKRTDTDFYSQKGNGLMPATGLKYTPKTQSFRLGARFFEWMSKWG